MDEGDEVVILNCISLQQSALFRDSDSGERGTDLKAFTSTSGIFSGVTGKLRMLVIIEIDPKIVFFCNFIKIKIMKQECTIKNIYIYILSVKYMQFTDKECMYRTCTSRTCRLAEQHY